MLKSTIIIIIYTCICVINCSELKCDYNPILDLNSSDKDREQDKNDFCKNKMCVFRRCRQPNSMYLIRSSPKVSKCVSLDEIAKLTSKSLEVPVYTNNSTLTPSKKRISDFHFVAYRHFGKLLKNECFTNPLDGDWHLLENGSLTTNDTLKLNVPLQGFVMEFLMIQKPNGDWVGPSIVAHIKTGGEHVMIPTKDIYDITGFLISSVFLILVLVVYFWLRQLQGQYVKMFMAYVACLAVAFALNAVKLLGLNYGLFGKIGCKSISSFLYYSLMTSYFWLNVIAFEIWNAFRPKNEFRSRTSRDYDHNFLRACLYSFGMPLIMLIAVTILDEVNLTTVKPNFEDCMHSRGSDYFHYVPITIILCVNLLFFVMTTYHLYQKKQGKTLNSADSRMSRRDRNTISLYIKLSVSTGVDWIFDLLDVFVKLPSYMNYIIATYTNFIGVILFILLCVCNKTIVKLVCKRFNITNRFINQSSVHSSNVTQSSGRMKGSRNKSNSDEQNP